MNASRKVKQRLDYQVLHSTGDRVKKEVDTVEGQSPQESPSPVEALEEGRSPQESPVKALDEALKKLTLNSVSDHVVVSNTEAPATPSGLLDHVFDEELIQDQVQIIEEPNQDIMAVSPEILAEELTLAEDIDDFQEENEVKEIGKNVGDHDLICRQIEELRTAYRTKHNQMKSSLDPDEYKEKYEAAYKGRIEKIKQFIKAVKAQRQSLRQGEDRKAENESEAKATKFMFIEKEIRESITRLDSIFTINEEEWSKLSDDDVTKRKSDITKHMDEVKSLTSRFTDMMDSSAGVTNSSTLMDTQRTRYDKILSTRDSYSDRLRKEVKVREIEEQKAFDKSKLNITLAKFSGYKSSVDIYTFQTNFEKIHKTTPKSFRPDLIKNNYLEGSALLLVKDVNEIDDIWKRLKEAYGDCRIMLQKKLEKIDAISGLWTHKSPEKVIDGMNRVINLMRDLMQLAKQHSIENKLYLGDALQRITGLLGDEQLHRWLSISCDKSLEEGETQWLEPTLFSLRASCFSFAPRSIAKIFCSIF